MKKSHSGAVAALIIAAGLTAAAGAEAKGLFAGPPGGRGNGPVVYVPGQGLAYDSIVLATLPGKGPFQQLEMAGPTGLQTEYGPGDPGYLGGRWWVDADMDGVMGEGDVYFLCPLLGPGFEPAS